ncbi:DNA pilot protein [Sigmofec virus UA08Rod_5824]|uniref:DNA pilot protein n=1 Tax=Sigmofec virus UA08Rod_5824 TaxID=2929441 RepID=A0A976N0X7_9VIRU|nr:DNA pilot protein [Sigmofec virus UA08Rod_5824]
MAGYTSARLVANSGPKFSSAVTYSTPSGNISSVNGSPYFYSDSSTTARDYSNDIASYLSQALGVARENSAFNAEEAAKQRDWSSREAEITREFNAVEAGKNRDWQKMMSDTAHQREVADLIAAGLNPVLSATGGNGASVTSGSSASAALPSGSSAHADTSGSAAVANILGSLLTAQTRLLEMTTNAETQRAVADKYTAAQQLTALISADASKYGANLSSAASRYSADQHLAGTRYSADRSLAATIGAAGIHADASRYAADASAYAHQYGSDVAAAASRYAAEMGYAGKRDFPSNIYGATGSLLSLLVPRSTDGSSTGALVNDIISGDRNAALSKVKGDFAKTKEVANLLTILGFPTTPASGKIQSRSGSKK